jgi:hypothetical protein
VTAKNPRFLRSAIALGVALLFAAPVVQAAGVAASGPCATAPDRDPCAGGACTKTSSKTRKRFSPEEVASETALEGREAPLPNADAFTGPGTCADPSAGCGEPRVETVTIASVPAPPRAPAPDVVPPPPAAPTTPDAPDPPIPPPPVASAPPSTPPPATPPTPPVGNPNTPPAPSPPTPPVVASPPPPPPAAPPAPPTAPLPPSPPPRTPPDPPAPPVVIEPPPGPVLPPGVPAP